MKKSDVLKKRINRSFEEKLKKSFIFGPSFLEETKDSVFKILFEERQQEIRKKSTQGNPHLKKKMCLDKNERELRQRHNMQRVI